MKKKLCEQCGNADAVFKERLCADEHQNVWWKVCYDCHCENVRDEVIIEVRPLVPTIPTVQASQ